MNKSVFCMKALHLNTSLLQKRRVTFRESTNVFIKRSVFCVKSPHKSTSLLQKRHDNLESLRMYSQKD